MPRGLAAADLVERFYSAFTAQDLDAFVAVLDPAIELQTARGPREGLEEARAWARKSPVGALDQRIVVEEVKVDPRGAHAVALVRRQWWWCESQELALDEPAAAMFAFRDGLIARWQPYADRDEALELLAELSACDPSDG